MALDYSIIGNVVQSQMEALEADHDADCHCEIKGVVIVTVIQGEAQDGSIVSGVRIRPMEEMTRDEVVGVLLGATQAAWTGLTWGEGG